jgi:hypothetical protein
MLTAKITGTAKLVAAFATAKWRANFAVSECIFIVGRSRYRGR